MPDNAAQLDARSPATPPQKSKGMARLLSLDRLDGRTIAARRARELVEAIEADLGGADRLSEGTKQLTRRAAVLGVFIENSEAAWLAGQEVALGDYLSAINSQRRVLTTIGLSRVPRDVETLEQYLAAQANEPSIPDDDDSGTEAPSEATVEKGHAPA
jgi:hypothetical protein